VVLIAGIVSIELGVIFGTLAAGFVFYVHFWNLERRPINIKCPKCSKFILSDTPWICGLNGCRNELTDEFPFVHQCQICGAKPKAYQCHHCNELIYFTLDEDRQNFATRAGKPIPNVPVEIKPVESETTRRRKRQADLEWDIHEARLETELAQQASRRKEARGERKSLEEIYKEDKEATVNNVVIFRRENALLEKEWAHDPDMLEQLKKSLEDFRDRHSV
jgi:hypothetical protein